MINKIERYIFENKLIEEKDKIWVALSGGADSTCLLHSLLQLKDKYDLSIKAIHINHMIRAKEALEDKAHCIEVCKKWKVKLLLKDVDVVMYKNEHKITLEQAGRQVRYIEFEKLKGKVAIGHNKNDNVETIIMNIIRGTSSDGLSGIKAKSGKYIRPILGLYRSDIEKYCEINKLEYIIDSSNSDNKYFRNAIRNQVIPLLNDISNKQINENLLRLSSIAKEETKFIDSIMQTHYKKIVRKEGNKIVINNILLIKRDKVIAKRIIRKAVLAVKGNLKDIEYIHTNNLYNMCKENITGKKINLPEQISGLVQFNNTYIYKEEKVNKFDYIIKVPGKTIIENMDITIMTSLIDEFEITKPTDKVHFFNYDSITEEIHFRNRVNGDSITPYKGNGTKKLKKYFIDKKIDRFKRNDLILLAMGNSIIYINGYDYGKEYLPKENHKVLRVEVIKRVVL